MSLDVHDLFLNLYTRQGNFLNSFCTYCCSLEYIGAAALGNLSRFNLINVVEYQGQPSELIS